MNSIAGFSKLLPPQDPTFQVVLPTVHELAVPFFKAVAICGTMVASIKVRPTVSKVPLMVTRSYSDGSRFCLN